MADTWMEQISRKLADEVCGQSLTGLKVANVQHVALQTLLLRAMQEQRERDCKLICAGCDAGYSLTDTMRHISNGRAMFQCKAAAIRKGEQ